MTSPPHLPFAEAEIESTIIARWQRVVAQFADRIAVKMDTGVQYTYAELDHASNHLAHRLLDRVGPENIPIVLLFHHSYPLVVSILGTLKAGKAYVAFDSKQTTDQLQLLNQITAAPVIVTTREHDALARSIVAEISEENRVPQEIWHVETLPQTHLDCPNVSISADTIAGLFFTSGTIKEPKGIARSHRTLLHRCWFGAATQPLTPDDCVAGIRQCGLGGGVFDLFSALLYGATYCFYHLQDASLQELAAWLQREQISYFHPPIMLFRQWLDMMAPGEFYPHLRFVLPSGRKTRADLEGLWPHVRDECVVLTSYSTTETTQITATAIMRTTPLADGVIHVGMPLPGKTVTVIDDDGQPVTPGEVGEVVVRSRYIATGYWRQPALTAQRFAATDDGSGETIYRTGDFGRFRSDGHLELVGRQDSQVKLRGYRVVLTEVEDALCALPAVREAAVTANEERGQLCAYLIATDDPPTPPTAIRAALAARFPDYALPTHILYLPSFPLLRSGKIDRKALPAPPNARPALAVPYAPPQTTVEERLVALWEELLQIEGIGIHDSFFELGGHSILAMRLITEVQQHFGQVIPMLALAQTPTIAQIALTLKNMTQHDETTRNIHVDEAAAGPTVSDLEIDFAIRRERSGTSSLPRWRRYKSVALSTIAPFPLRAQWLAWYSAKGAVQQRQYKERVQLVRDFYAAMTHPRPTLAETVQQSIMANLWLNWGVLRLHQTDPAKLAEWFTVNGLGNLRAAADQGRGVLLARSHTLFSQQALFVLAQHGFENVVSIGLGRTQRTLQGKADDTYLMAVRSHLLFQTHQALAQGEVVSILPDGHHGSGNGITAPFHSRRRMFRSGFAELAIDTGAPVVPVFVSSNLAGRFHVEFAPTLRVDPKASREEQVAALVLQYVELLRTHWATYPADIPWPQMHRHLALSKISG